MEQKLTKALKELKKQFDELNKILSERYPKKKRRSKKGVNNATGKN